jgi:PAS domain S-box-containing protein
VVPKRTNIPLEKILTHTPQFIFWKDINSIYLGCNQNFAHIAGFKNPSDIVGKTDYDLPWGKLSADTYLEEDQIILKTGRPVIQKEVSLVTSQNQEIIIVVSKSPLYDNDNQVIGILGIYMDISERKKMEDALRIAKEKAEAGNLAKTEFIANMSHDIRTPMSGVIGIAKMLETEGDSEKDREYGHIIHSSSERLLRLLNDILEVISAEETRKELLRPEVFSIQERIEHLHDLIVPNIQPDQIKLIINVDPKVPAYLIADRVKLDRILLNLASNALKFTQEGEIVISVGLISKKKSCVTLEIKISDTGTGISPDKLDKIFERFYRVCPTYENKYGGHGIGLFIVQKYVSLLGGSISVTSKFGEGTTFTVELPMKVGKKTAIRPTTDEKQTNSELDSLTLQLSQANKPLESLALTKHSKSKNTFRGLLIEDDTVARFVAKSAFEKAGFEIDDVSDAEEGLKKIMEKTYDLIVTDIGLPGINGTQFTEIARCWERTTKHSRIPIIGLTAHGKNHEATAKLAGMDDILTKPIDDTKIKQVIDRFFKRKNIKQKAPKKATKPQLGQDLPNDEEALFLLDAYPLFDEKSGVIASSNEALLIEILTMLVEQSIPEELEALERAHKELDWQAIQDIAHKMKGGALYCGTTRMRFACQYMERYLLAGHRKLADKLYQQLIAVLESTKNYIDNWLLKHSSSS